MAAGEADHIGAVAIDHWFLAKCIYSGSMHSNQYEPQFEFYQKKHKQARAYLLIRSRPGIYSLYPHPKGWDDQ